MIYPYFEIDERILKTAETAENDCKDIFSSIEENSAWCSQKVLSAFNKNKVSERHFNQSTGYGYDDEGRECLDRTVADAFGAESALVRHNFTCGTHTLCTALFGVLRPNDTMLCISGTPYDTIHSVIGINGAGKGQGSLSDFGVNYRQLDLVNGKMDLENLKNELSDFKCAMVYIQRSRGYALRSSFSLDEIKEVCETVHNADKNCIVMVDNCYGEFTDKKEPTDVGADLMAGSLIKNPGGGIARTGGYIAGRKDLVDLCAYRLTTPGLGSEVGATLGTNREMFMGFYNAPNVTGQALKTAVFAARLFELFGYNVSPGYKEKRNDIVEQIDLCKKESLIAFCRGMQKGAPVDSFVTPEPWPMPGYDCDVIMSAGAFTLGSSIELSGDAPLREPFSVFMQGGINYDTAKIGILLAAQEMKNEGVLYDT